MASSMLEPSLPHSWQRAPLIMDHMSDSERFSRGFGISGKKCLRDAAQMASVNILLKIRLTLAMVARVMGDA